MNAMLAMLEAAWAANPTDNVTRWAYADALEEAGEGRSWLYVLLRGTPEQWLEMIPGAASGYYVIETLRETTARDFRTVGETARDLSIETNTLWWAYLADDRWLVQSSVEDEWLEDPDGPIEGYEGPYFGVTREGCLLDWETWKHVAENADVVLEHGLTETALFLDPNRYLAVLARRQEEVRRGSRE